MLHISEIFISIQGEGPLIGRPAVFLRLAGCNLDCIWCDTKYARKPRFVWSIDKVTSVISKLLTNTNLIVITGGEPLLQANELRKLLARIREIKPGVIVQLETNATLSIDPVKDLIDVVVASPKLSNSGNPPDKRKIHDSFIDIARASRPLLYLKFVIDKEDDIYEVNDIVNKLKVCKERVYLMPQCTTLEEQLEKLKLVTRLALRYGYCVSPRLQILLNIR